MRVYGESKLRDVNKIRKDLSVEVRDNDGYAKLDICFFIVRAK